MRKLRSAQGCRGFALMMAVFLIVTLAAVAVYLVTISTGQLEAASQDEEATRAYQAARTGMDWGAYQLLRNPTTNTFATNCAGGAGSQNLTFTTPQLSRFRAEISCTRVGSETEAGVTVVVYRLTIKACNGSPTACGSSVGPTYVERELQLTLTN